MKPIKNYPLHIAKSDNTRGDTDTAYSVVGRQGSNEPNSVNQNDGWICKLCYMSGNQQNQCKMCKQDEANIKNRRSKLHSEQSIRVDKERNRKKRIAVDIANNIRNYCQKVEQCKIYYQLLVHLWCYHVITLYVSVNYSK